MEFFRNVLLFLILVAAYNIINELTYFLKELFLLGGRFLHNSLKLDESIVKEKVKV